MRGYGVNNHMGCAPYFGSWEHEILHLGPAVIDAQIDPYEAPMPGHISSTQAWHFAKAMIRGEKDRWNNLKTVIKNKVRRVF